MNRALLCSAIEEVVSPLGYEFYQNDESGYPTLVCRYPAAFLSHPEFHSIEGRKRGKITYDISLRLARQGAKSSPKERRMLLDEMEEALVDIFVALSQNPIVAIVEELTILPDAEVDTHGAVSMVATAKVATLF